MEQTPFWSSYGPALGVKGNFSASKHHCGKSLTASDTACFSEMPPASSEMLLALKNDQYLMLREWEEVNPSQTQQTAGMIVPEPAERFTFVSFTNTRPVRKSTKGTLWYLILTTVTQSNQAIAWCVFVCMLTVCEALKKKSCFWFCSLVIQWLQTGDLSKYFSDCRQFHPSDTHSLSFAHTHVHTRAHTLLLWASLSLSAAASSSSLVKAE